MAHHYIGTTTKGLKVTRKSNRPDFTHAAVSLTWAGASLPSFGTSAQGASRNLNDRRGCEVVPVRVVSAKEYRDFCRA